MRLYVGNLAADATDKCLFDLFGKYGISGECSVMRSSKKSFAIVHVEDGERAVRDLNGCEVQGSILKVMRAVDRKRQCSLTPKVAQQR